MKQFIIYELDYSIQSTISTSNNAYPSCSILTEPNPSIPARMFLANRTARQAVALSSRAYGQRRSLFGFSLFGNPNKVCPAVVGFVTMFQSVFPYL